MIKFSAEIKKHTGIDAGFIEFPFSTEELFGKKGQVKVKALFDENILYRGSLAKMGHHCHMLGITKEIRGKLNKTFGDFINIELEEDLDKREVNVPVYVLELLKKHPEAREFFGGLSFTCQKEYIVWIESAKKTETREKRLAVFIDKLIHKKKWDQE